jgi:hypothetical protein
MNNVDAKSYPDPFLLKNWVKQAGEVPVRTLFGENTEFAFKIYSGQLQNKEFDASSSETWFYQLQGRLSLSIGNRSESFKLEAGESYVLPPNFKYTVTRDEASIGLVMMIRK